MTVGLPHGSDISVAVDYLGNGITVLPVTAELTTQQAADLLNVSRPFFVVGTHVALP